MKKIVLLLFVVCCYKYSLSQLYPQFGPEKAVAINGYNLDAMEPFISADGNALFFNSLNDGVNTNIYYAAKVNDTVFNLVGLVPGAVNQSSTPHLNAVASLDSSNNFFWVSTRNYPTEPDNLHRTTSFSSVNRVHGDIYIYKPGWIIMDAAVNFYGDKLIYCNAWFNNCAGTPCTAALGLARKLNDSTFAKLSNSGTVLAAVNDTSNYIVYAPQLTKDELELYYTRLLKGSTQTEICVAVRADTSAAFSSAKVLVSTPALVPEAPTVSTDKNKLYYHKKSGNSFKLFLRYRDTQTGYAEIKNTSMKVFPNPVSASFNIIPPTMEKNWECVISDLAGQQVYSSVQIRPFSQIDISILKSGVYLLTLKCENQFYIQKLVKQ